jgi:thiol:disulfide interchange protein DsbA
MFVILFVALAFVAAVDVQGAQSWLEGKDFAILSPVQRTSVPAGKIEVMEVFSYGCIACDSFQPTMDKLRRSLPANSQVVLLPASFNAGEDWPMFQRAYLAARSLGVAEAAHQGIFDAVWKTGELAISRRPQPTIQDAARCYARIAKVSQQAFLQAANSFGVSVQMNSADAQIAAMQVPSTPCIVVNGKYRIDMGSVHSSDELIDLVKFLVNRESADHSVVHR